MLYKDIYMSADQSSHLYISILLDTCECNIDDQKKDDGRDILKGLLIVGESKKDKTDEKAKNDTENKT